MPFYIGICKDKNRPYNKKDRSKFWKRIVNKTDYFVEIIFENLTKEEAIQKEIEFIKLYGRVDTNSGTLCNMTCGGEGTGDLNKNKEFLRRERISQSLKGLKHTEYSKLKNCLSHSNRMPVTIDGVEYPSLRSAEKALGIHKNTIKKLYCIK